MRPYDPYETPLAPEWLAADEGQRIAAVLAWHEGAKIRLPNARLHAAIHVVVETQLAMGEQIVMDTLDRLQAEGLDRHDAVHAVGGVLANQLLAAIRQPTDKTTLAIAYLEALKTLTAESWLRAAD